MNKLDIVLLRRDCEAMLIPSGAPIMLQKDTEITITQALGGSFTVNVYGNLVRIAGKDADALGREHQPFADIDMENTSLEDLVWLQLKTCFDPEIPVNVVDLGLVYDCNITETANDEYTVAVIMTLTAPGCGMGPVLAEDIKHKLLEIPSVKQAEVEIVFDPPWQREMMSEEAKLQLGMYY